MPAPPITVIPEQAGIHRKVVYHKEHEGHEEEKPSYFDRPTPKTMAIERKNNKDYSVLHTNILSIVENTPIRYNIIRFYLEVTMKNIYLSHIKQLIISVFRRIADLFPILNYSVQVSVKNPDGTEGRIITKRNLPIHLTRKQSIIYGTIIFVVLFNVFSPVMEIKSPGYNPELQDNDLLQTTENIKKLRKSDLVCQDHESLKHIISPYFSKNSDKEKILYDLKNAGFAVYETKDKRQFKFHHADTSYTANELIYKNTMPMGIRMIFIYSSLLLSVIFPPFYLIMTDPGVEYRIIVSFKDNILHDYDAVMFCQFL